MKATENKLFLCSEKKFEKRLLYCQLINTNLSVLFKFIFSGIASQKCLVLLWARDFVGGYGVSSPGKF